MSMFEGVAGRMYQPADPEAMPEREKKFRMAMRGLPMGLNGVIGIFSAYLEGRLDRASFLKTFLDRTTDYMKMVHFRKDREEFEENYAAAFACVREMLKLQMTPEIPDFDRSMDAIVQRFLDAPRPKKIYIR